MRTAPIEGRRAEEIFGDSGVNRDSTPWPAPQIKSALFTAVPAGRCWRVKVIAPSGDTALLGTFDGRLPALGAAVLMAAQAEGQVCP